MSRRLEKLIEQKAWETLPDYGQNDAHLLEQLTESVLKRLNGVEDENLSEQSLPIPAGAPAGGFFRVDDDGNLVYVVYVPGEGNVVYDLNGKIRENHPFSGDPFDFSPGGLGTRMKARKKPKIDPSLLDRDVTQMTQMGNMGGLGSRPTSGI